MGDQNRFLLTISIQNQADKRRKQRKISKKGLLVNLIPNFKNQHRKNHKAWLGVAEWYGCWTCKLVVPGSSPLPCHYWIFFSVASSSTPRLHCENSKLLCLLPVGIFKHFVFISVIVKRYCLAIKIALFE